MSTPPLAVAFREVRHFKPEDWLHCEPVALRAKAMAWTIPAHRHEGLHQFMFLASGAARVTLDDAPQAMAAPSMLMVAPGCVHALEFRRRSDGVQITVPSARLEQALGDAPALAASLATSRMLDADAVAPDVARLSAWFAALAAEFEGSALGRHEVLQAHLVLIATWFLRQAAPLPTAVASRRAWRDTLVQRFRALVELHLRRHQPLTFYARQLKVTPDHLSRACRTTTGQSALDLLQERLFIEARRLLAFTDAPVSDVARDLGFEDASYFSRFFARHAGRSPQAFRTAVQAGEAIGA